MNVRYFEKNGCWWIDVRSAGNRKRLSTGTGDRTEAGRREPALVAQALAAFAEAPAPRPSTVVAAQPSAGPTLRAAYDLAMKTREKWMQAKDKASLRITFDNLGLPEDFPVAGLTRDKVRELRAQWVEEEGKRKGTKLSASTINHRLSMLTILLETADLPPHTVKHLSVKGTRRTRRINQKELAGLQSWLFANAQRKGALAMADLITVALGSAARASELLGLQPGDYRDGAVILRDTKNGETRTVPLPEASRRVLEARSALPGGPFAELSLSQMEQLWREAREALGLGADEEFVFHILRHEALSQLADAGANAFVIQAIAGHSDIATTQIYVKASQQAMREAQALSEQRSLLTNIQPQGGMQ